MPLHEYTRVDHRGFSWCKHCSGHGRYSSSPTCVYVCVCAMANVTLTIGTPCDGVAGYEGTMGLIPVWSGYSSDAKKLCEDNMHMHMWSIGEFSSCTIVAQCVGCRKTSMYFRKSLRQDDTAFRSLCLHFTVTGLAPPQFHMCVHITGMSTGMHGPACLKRGDHPNCTKREVFAVHIMLSLPVHNAVLVQYAVLCCVS